MGGGSPKNTTTTTKTELDPATRAMQESTYRFAQGVAEQPYSGYGGQAVAPLNGMQQYGIDLGSMYAQQGVGMGSLNLGADMANRAGSYQPQMVGTGQWGADAAKQYMSPYTQSVIDATNSQIERNTLQTTNNTNAAAVQAGAFGGTRQAVQTAENQRNADQIKAQTAATLNDQAYSNAQGMFTADQQRQLAASQGNQSAGLQAANLGLGSADLLGRLGLSQQQAAYGNANALLNYGGVTQGQQQQVNDYNLGQFNEQRDWGLRNLSALQGTMSGMPSGQTASASAPIYKNKTAGALGGAASGAAMGSYFGPWGTAIGAVAGGLYGAYG